MWCKYCAVSCLNYADSLLFLCCDYTVCCCRTEKPVWKSVSKPKRICNILIWYLRTFVDVIVLRFYVGSMQIYLVGMLISLCADSLVTTFFKWNRVSLRALRAQWYSVSVVIIVIVVSLSSFSSLKHYPVCLSSLILWFLLYLSTFKAMFSLTSQSITSFLATSFRVFACLLPFLVP